MSKVNFNLHEFCQDLDGSRYEMTPKQAVIAKCFQCSVGDASEVQQCVTSGCPLFEFRKIWCPSKVMPKKELTEEQKQIMRARLKKSVIS